MKMPVFKGCNGRPQLWYSERSIACPESEGEKLRIVYPNGTVQYSPESFQGIWFDGCTSGDDQEDALDKLRIYADGHGTVLEFLGYL